MKKKVLIAIIIIVIIFIGILYIFNFFKPVTTEINLSNNLKFEYGKEVYLYDTISITDGTILDENFLLSTDELGLKEITVKYKDSNKWKHEYKYNIEIIDTTAPILSIKKDLYIGVGSNEESLFKNTFWGDNCDREVDVTINGEYNLNTIGNYPVEVIAKDDSNNIRKIETTIHVYEPKNIENNNQNKITNSGIDIKYFINNYKNEKTSIGLDISEHQTITSFEDIKNSGIEFVIFRIGWGPNSDLSFNDDKKFEEYYKLAKEVGLKVGVYYFSYANKLEEVDNEINYVLDMLKDKEIDLWVSYDWENWKMFKNAHINFVDLNKMANKFIKAMNNNGYKGMNYGSKAFLEEIWNTDGIDTWLAHYSKETNYDKPFKLWQISDEGNVPGITGAVDVDIMIN